MSTSRVRLASIVTATALLMAVSAVGPASAATPQRHFAAEKLAMRLLNCTRTGGWVQADGICVGRGTGQHSAYVKPLRRSKEISRRVAFRWAREMAKADVCGHVIAGKPELRQRLASKGFRHNYYGENVGCMWGGTPREMVIRTHRAFQDEKGGGGWHWRNIKNAGFKSVGVGVASIGGSTRVVYDFYGR